MRLIATVRLAWSVGLSVCALQKRLNRSRCRLGWGLGTTAKGAIWREEGRPPHITRTCGGGIDV